MLQPEKLSPNHEELFLQRYTLLRGWALRLTGNDQQQAEDLLHDAFIHFSIHHPALEEIKNLEGYLHAMLRNLHLSQSRRAARSVHGHFLILDYDSAEKGLYAIDPHEQIKVQDELRTICKYACLRKDSSRAGSVLILRFFHGYYPDEIAQVMRCTRSAVEHHLRAARTEARIYLQNPEALAFMQKRRDADPAPIDVASAQESVLESLRQDIFHSAHGECLSVAELDELYTEGLESLNCATSAHIVSCHSCLDKVNARLGLPPLSERNAADSLGPNTRSKGGSGGGPSGGATSTAVFAKQSRRRMRQVLKHYPQELHISVNGFILGSQKISSEVSELTLNVSLDEKIGFVEVFSESDVRLFFLNVELPPDGPVEQPSQIELSDGRSLELALNFSDTWPKLYCVYRDPLLAEIPASEKVALEEKAKKKEAPEPNVFESLRALISYAKRSFTNWNPWLSPGTVATILAALLIAGGLLIKLHVPVAPISAAELLHQSTAAEEANAARTDQILHRTISLEETRSVPGAVATGSTRQLLTRRRIEVWQSPEKGITARRLYSERGELVAGDWRRADGVQTIYHHGSRPELQLPPDKRSGGPVLNFDNVWQLDISAKEFSAVIDQVARASVQERSGDYVLRYENNDRNGLNNLVTATIVLRRMDLHPVEQSLTIAQGREMREYRFTESVFELKPASAVTPAIFEPERELLGAKEERGRISDTNANLSPLPPFPPSASAEFEIEVLRLLNEAGVFLRDQVSVTRTPTGQLSVGGIVETEQRKREIASALAPVTASRAVRVEVETVAEVLQRQQARAASDPVMMEGVSVTEAHIPVDSELRKFLLEQQGIPDAQLDTAERQFADRVLAHSNQARLHALALRPVIDRFSMEELQSLSDEARSKWRSIIVEHVRAFGRETAALRRELQPLFPTFASAADSHNNVVVASDADLVRAVRRLMELASANDEAVRRSFSISANSGKGAPVKTARFWTSLATSGSLAAAIVSISQK